MHPILLRNKCRLLVEIYRFLGHQGYHCHFHRNPLNEKGITYEYIYVNFLTLIIWRAAPSKIAAVKYMFSSKFNVPELSASKIGQYLAKNSSKCSTNPHLSSNSPSFNSSVVTSESLLRSSSSKKGRKASLTS